MRLTHLLDTNAVIYLQKGLLAAPLPEGVYGISIITEIELRSFSDLTADQQAWLRRFLDSIYIVGLTEAIKEQVIQLRQRYRIKLPDAIIAATAIQEQAILLTNDRQLHAIDILNSAELLITPS
ncbi:type II toxin-antitoxin system VapC family toxin [Methylomagnum sp.]